MVKNKLYLLTKDFAFDMVFFALFLQKSLREKTYRERELWGPKQFLPSAKQMILEVKTNRIICQKWAFRVEILGFEEFQISILSYIGHMDIWPYALIDIQLK